MDEGECLSVRQQRTLNMLIRVTEWPVSYVVSYVGPPRDVTNTLYDNLTHQKVDRNITVLDSLSSTEFRDFCDGVATVRVLSHLESKGVSFDAERVLGPLDLNGLVDSFIQPLESSIAREIRDAAEIFAKSNWAAARAQSTKRPYIESYLASRLKLLPPDEAVTMARRKQESSEYRKKIVAAYLSICRELKLKNIPYASAKMVLGISDRCIRDFLSQMDHIFNEAKLDLHTFLIGVIPLKVQIKAIRTASEDKVRSIPDLGVLQPLRIGRLVKGLAKLTAMLQQGSSDTTHLRSSERGSFVLGSGMSSTSATEIDKLIQDAADAGLLRLPSCPDLHPTFRVHLSLAPAYGFSYRGAYYPVAVKISEVQNFLECEDEGELDNAVLEAFRRIQRSEDAMHPTLFPVEDIVLEEPEDDA